MADQEQGSGVRCDASVRAAKTEALSPDDLFTLGVATVVEPVELSDELGAEGARWNGRYAVRTSVPAQLVEALEGTARLAASLVVVRVPRGQMLSVFGVEAGPWRFSLAAIVVGPAKEWLADAMRHGTLVLLLDIAGGTQFSLLEVSCGSPTADWLGDAIDSSPELSGDEDAAVVSGALTASLKRLGAFDQHPDGGTHVRVLLPQSAATLH